MEIGFRWALRRLMAVVLGVGLVLMLLATVNPKSETCPECEAYRGVHNPQSISVVRAGSGSISQNGSAVTLPVEAVGVQDLGAATVVVGYDPAVLEVAGCQYNPEFDLGMCNPEFDRDEDGAPDAVRFNVISLEGRSTTGDVPLNLVDITWAVAGRPDVGSRSSLEVEVLTFDTWDGTPIDVAVENGQVAVVSTAASTGTPTATSTLTRTPASTGTPTPTATSTTSPLNTPPATATATETPASTSTLTGTPSATHTPPATSTPTQTQEAGRTPTATPTGTPTPTGTVAAPSWRKVYLPLVRD